MIQIRQSKTADSRTSSYEEVSKHTLYESSKQHIGDVKKGLQFLQALLDNAADIHDHDKLSDIDGFHRDFVKGFEPPNTTWWQKHKQVNRHHVNDPAGVPRGVNLIDILEMVVDHVMAGKGRSGEVRIGTLPPEVLADALENTYKLLIDNVEVVSEDKATV